MKMTENEQARLKAVENLLEETRASETSVSAELVHRVLSDAARVQPVAPSAHKDRAKAVRFKWCRFEVFGAFGGLVTASCVGFWLGLNPPGALGGVDLLGAEPWDSAFVEDVAEVSGFGWDVGES